MHRIDTPTAQKDKFGHGKNGFTRGNPQTGTPATQIDYSYCDAIQEEIANVIESRGVTLDKTKHDQLKLAIQQYVIDGKVQLSSSTNSTSETEAATPKAVKIAYDLASNAVKKSGDEMSGQLQFNASAAGIKFKYETGAQIVLRTGGHSFGFMFNDAESERWMSKLRYNYDTNIWNFENINNVTINGKPALKAGDYGIGGQTGAEVTNFDEHLNSGFYGTNSSKVTNSPHPTPASASLMILPTENQNWKIEQLSVVSGNAPRIYYRADTKNSGKQQWIESITSANVEKYAYRFCGLLSNQNLNDIRGSRHGIYFQNSNVNTSFELNYPVNDAGSLSVQLTQGDGIDGCVQIYSLYKDSRQFIRTYRGSQTQGFWSPWVEQLTTANINDYLPVGIPLPWPQTTPPAGWLKCNGWQFDKNKYPKLAKAYPSGYLPELRGETVRGWDDGRGVDPGRQILSWQSDAIRNIWGEISPISETFASEPIATGVFKYFEKHAGHTPTGIDVGSVGGVVFDASNLVPTAHENRVRSVAFLYIVKAE